MAIGRSLCIDRTAQAETLDDPGRPEIDRFLDPVPYRRNRQCLRSEGIDAQRNRLRHADSIRKLDLTTPGESRRNNVLSEVARHIRRAAIDLGRVFPGKRAAAVACIAAVGVNDDLPSCQSGIARGAADHKSAGRIDVQFCRFIDHARRQDVTYDLLRNVFPQRIHVHIRFVLARNDDRGDPPRRLVLIYDGDLRLAVRQQIWDLSAFPHLLQPARQAVCKRDGQRHVIRRVIAGVPEHHALIARAAVRGLLAVNAHGDVRRLRMHVHHDLTAFCIKAVTRPCIADVADRIACDRFIIDRCVCSDLTHDMDFVRYCRDLAGNMCRRVFCKNCIQNAIGDLVADLVGVTCCNGFRGKIGFHCVFALLL